jgi:uncharacterized protein YbcV (DUF1398 family)
MVLAGPAMGTNRRDVMFSFLKHIACQAAFPHFRAQLAPAGVLAGACFFRPYKAETAAFLKGMVI